MAVYKRTYKVYQGQLSPSWSRFGVLTRYSLSAIFDSKLFTAYFVLCFLSVLVAIAFIYVVHSQIAQSLLGMRLGSGDALAINNHWFAAFIQIQTSLAFIMVAWCAPGLVTRDFANQALQLYFSRPLSRTEYILGKISVLAFLTSCITWAPALLLFGLQAGLAGNGWGWDNLYVAGAIFVSSWLWIAVICLLALAVSVFVRWRIVATLLLLGLLFVLPGFGEAFNAILRTNWGRLLNISYALQRVRSHMFHIAPISFGNFFIRDLPLWSAWVVILTTCLISLLLLNRRLKAREVERA